MINPNDKMRETIDKITDDIFDRAREMIAQDVPVETAYRLAISWELEVTMLKSQIEFNAMLMNTTTVRFKPKTS